MSSPVLRVGLVGLIAGGTSGVPRYAHNLIRALDSVAGEFPLLALRLLTTTEVAALTKPEHLQVEVVPVMGEARGGPRRILAEQLAARRAAVDLLHFFDLSGPALAYRRRFTTTVHDAALRHGFESLRLAHKQLLQPFAVRRAEAIVAVSQFSKQEAVQHFHADERKVHVVHSGPGLSTNGARGELSGAEQDVSEPAPRDPYLLYVGNLSAHKNLPFLIRAFGEAGVPARLVLAGTRGERVAEVEDVLSASPARERIEVLRGATDEEIDRLYRRAVALLLPSRYEGFGFTALEAMSRGCPVLASDIPALREISGGGSWLLPLDDTAGWAAAMREVLADPGRRTALSARGRGWVSRYSWERTARELCALFGRVGER